MMENKHWLFQVPFLKSVFFTLSAIYCIAPGIIYCYINMPVFFANTELVKLLLLVASFSTLLFAINYLVILFLVSCMTRKNLDNEVDYKTSGHIIIAFYTIVFFINLISFLLFDEFQTIKTAIISFYSIMGIFVFGGLISYFENKWNNKKR